MHLGLLGLVNQKAAVRSILFRGGSMVLIAI